MQQKASLLLLLLWCLVSVGAQQRKPRLMVACGWHGREWATADLCRDWQRRVLEQPSTTAVEWFIVPEVNPDSLEAARSARNPCQRCNARGVDLNRNFPLLEQCPMGTPPIRLGDEERALLKPWNETYPGEYPLSEPESRRIADDVRRFAPDVLLLVHSGGDLISLPYDSCWSADEEPLYARQLGIGRWMATTVNISTDRVWPGLSVLYAAVGTFGDYARSYLNVPFVYTLETYQTSDPTLLSRSTASLSAEECTRYFNPLDLGAYLNRWARLAESFAALDHGSCEQLVHWSTNAGPRPEHN